MTRRNTRFTPRDGNIQECQECAQPRLKPGGNWQCPTVQISVPRCEIGCKNPDLIILFLAETPVKQGTSAHHRSPPVLNLGTGMREYHIPRGERECGRSTFINLMKDRMRNRAQGLGYGHNWPQ